MQKLVDTVVGPPAPLLTHAHQSDVLTPAYGETTAYTGQSGYSPAVTSIWDGDKFPGGFGLTELQYTDYWTVRERSGQMFRTNKYAKGLLRRLITNEINTGLIPEACPDEAILGLEEGALDDWAELVESRFGIWANSPHLCDWETARTFGELQEVARLEALIEGDVLCIVRQSKITKLPMLQLVRGNRVRTPFNRQVRQGNEIIDGVEMDSRGRQVAYWIVQEDATHKRIPAYGEKSGRRIAWLHYGTERRIEDIRGESLLGCILQSLREIDRYADSAQRQAVLASLIVGSVEKSEDKMGSLPITGGAVRKDTVQVSDSTSPTNEPRTLNIQGSLPGIFVEEMQVGESIKWNGGQGIDVNFGGFEEAIVQGIAWANEIPPEILRLAFSNNYSASQAAINEFKIYLNKRWKRTGDTLCNPVWIEWLLAEALLGKVDTPRLLESWRDPARYDIFGAITQAEWYGSIKPSTDMQKATKGSKVLVEEGWSTNARESRGLTGTKYSRNIRRLKKENAQKAEAMRPIAEFKQEFGEDQEANEAMTALENQLDDMLIDRGLLDD